MRILLVHNYYQHFGGEDGYVGALEKLLTAHGHEVALFTKSSHNIGSLPIQARTALMMAYNAEAKDGLNRLIRQFKPHLAQIQNLFPLISPSAYDACGDNGVPVIQRISNYRYLCPKATLFRDNAVCRKCIGLAYPYPAVIHGCYHRSRLASLFLSGSLYAQRERFRKISAYLFPTEFLKREYEKSLGLASEKTHVVPTFADDVPAERKSARGDYFVFVGRLSEEKGIIPLLEAFTRLPDLKLTVIGDGPLFRQAVRYRNSRIAFTGKLPKEQVARYMREALMTVIPSVGYDVLPQTLIESYREGTPVIAPNHGNFPSVVHPEKTGYLYGEDNLGDTLRKAVADKKKIGKMGQAAREMYGEYFSPEQHYRKLLSLYKNILMR